MLASTLGNRSSVRRIYAFSISVTIVALLGVLWGAGPAALLTVLILSALEITFSFDNAVINAKILARMSPVWQQLFMTVGIFIAVFGMRFVLPIALVAGTAGLDFGSVINLALQHPNDYANKLAIAHPIISAFGGIFLLMIFLEFMLDHDRKVHWLKRIERPLTKIGRLNQVSVIMGLSVLIWATEFLAGDHKFEVLLAGSAGLLTYLSVRTLAMAFEQTQKKSLANTAATHHLLRAGLSNFLYLEVLDASFSFDGVIGAFAITNMVLLIAIGLGIGAVWVRSMTIHIVRRNTLSKYIYLDHGANYAIGVLAVMLLAGIAYEIPDSVTGLAGVSIISFAFISSWLHNNQQALGTKS